MISLQATHVCNSIKLPPVLALLSIVYTKKITPIRMCVLVYKDLEVQAPLSFKNALSVSACIYSVPEKESPFRTRLKCDQIQLTIRRGVCICYYTSRTMCTYECSDADMCATFFFSSNSSFPDILFFFSSQCASEK